MLQDWLLLGTLAAALLATCWTDLTRQRIPNSISIPLLALGLASHGALFGFAGLGFSIAGSAVGFAAFFPMYLLGAMGGGDVKLMTSVGSFLGFALTLWALAFTLLCGGVLAVVYVVAAIIRRRLAGQNAAGPILLELAVTAETRGGVMQERFPYAVAIASGTAIAIMYAGGSQLPFRH